MSDTMKRYTNLIIEQDKDNDLVLIKLQQDRGDQNYLTTKFIKEILHVLLFVQREWDPKVIIFTGGGRVFSLGADLSEIQSLSRDEAIEFSQLGQSLIKRIRQLESVTIAAVNGMALGGGFELVLACDIRWAHSRAVFAFPECLRGLIPAWGGTQLATQIIPSSLVYELTMTGMYLGAENAYRCGIISRILHGPDFHEQVFQGAQQLACIDHDILKGLKVLFSPHLALSEGLRQESEMFADLVVKNSERS